MRMTSNNDVRGTFESPPVLISEASMLTRFASNSRCFRDHLRTIQPSQNSHGGSITIGTVNSSLPLTPCHSDCSIFEFKIKVSNFLDFFSKERRNQQLECTCRVSISVQSEVFILLCLQYRQAGWLSRTSRCEWSVSLSSKEMPVPAFHFLDFFLPSEYFCLRFHPHDESFQVPLL
jgi:hypothetical protein